MPVTIRRLTVTDAEPYVALRRAMLLDAPASFGSSPEDDRGSDPGEVRKRLAESAEQAVFGAFDDDAGLIGSVGVHRYSKLKERHKAAVWGMYVAPDFRRRAIGRQLMQAAIDFAQAMHGVTHLQLSVSDTAPGAQRLYESLGFTVWGTEPDALRIHGQPHAEHHLSLDLSNRNAD